MRAVLADLALESEPRCAWRSAGRGFENDERHGSASSRRPPSSGCASARWRPPAKPWRYSAAMATSTTADGAAVPRSAGQLHLGRLGQCDVPGRDAALQREPEAWQRLQEELAALAAATGAERALADCGRWRRCRRHSWRAWPPLRPATGADRPGLPAARARAAAVPTASSPAGWRWLWEGGGALDARRRRGLLLERALPAA
ncbi:Uncharacterised protein [Chromobacterium violaceum]|uniref:Uncharacterized protein n=1 Tax=Chromobacterium violaceum TaxID=536 RepID=A0A447TKQ3_CHRVL|nr:Uncharacterised protein [Chromobacterium violaceum]